MSERVRIWRRLTWWQWTLVVVFGLAAIGAILPPEKTRDDQVASKPKAPVKAPAFTAIANDVFAATIAPETDPNSLPDVARAHCGPRPFCKVIAWTDQAYVARGFPLTDREVEHEAYMYSLNRNTGLEQSQWDCKRWPRKNRDECL